MLPLRLPGPPACRVKPAGGSPLLSPDPGGQFSKLAMSAVCTRLKLCARLHKPGTRYTQRATCNLNQVPGGVGGGDKDRLAGLLSGSSAAGSRLAAGCAVISSAANTAPERRPPRGWLSRGSASARFFEPRPAAFAAGRLAGPAAALAVPAHGSVPQQAWVTKLYLLDASIARL